MVEKRFPDGGAVTLSSALSVGQRLGIPRGHFRERVYAVAHATFVASREHVLSVIDRMLGACRASREQLGSAVTAPLVFFRKRKYDGTRMKLTTTVSQVYDDDVICEHTVGAREVFVAKGQFGMMMRRRADGGAADFLHVHGTVPTHL
eukprot:4203298-Pyramimonas_sp.AAC.1